MDFKAKKILLATHGTRGDVQPFLALAAALRKAGHEVTFLGPPQGENFVKSQGFPFISLSGDFEALLKSDKFREAVETEKVENLSTAREWQESFGCWADEILQEVQGKDVVIINGWLLAHGYLVHKKTGIPTMFVTFQANYPTGKFSFTGLKSDEDPFRGDSKKNLELWEKYINFFSSLHEPLISGFLKKWNILDKSATPESFWIDLTQNLRLPFICAFFDESIAGRPEDWPDFVQIAGYLDMDFDEYKMPKHVEDFINIEPEKKPVFISFGSITLGKPEVLRNLSTALVNKLGRRVILAPGWTKPEDLEMLNNEKVLIENNVPYKYLFPKCSVVVHHGGSGTTSAALKYGSAQVIVPFCLDQPFWAKAMQYIGVGARPLQYGKFNEDEFIDAVKEALKEETQKKAEEIGNKVRKVNGANVAVDLIEKYISRIG